MRFLLSIIGSVIIVFLLFLFAPAGVREKIAVTVSQADFLPASLRTMAEKILLSPPQRRSVLLTELEKQLNKLKEVVEGPAAKNAAADIIGKSEKIIEKIKESNNDLGVVETVKNLAAAVAGAKCDKK